MASSLVDKVEPESPESEAASGAYAISESALSSVDQLLKQDQHDASLQRYKATLLGAAAHGDLGDVSDSRRVVVEEFAVVFEDQRPDIIYRLDTDEGLSHLKMTPFSMEEGAKYKFAIKFRVNGNIVSGLRFQNKVTKHLLSVKEDVVLGSYAPQSATHDFKFPRHGWSEAPAGLLYRGKYHAECKFADSEGVEHLRFSYRFDIKKA
ncbi:rho GDP-dissociation inhibitor [Achlya hypogyna]|uniref:Rho GDP-dissociation inhibitor n=1 Tax=Achlya hypogyna TaxID=1202772 RepID=A0A1V9YAA0_ACHHY|nr:rho GDP-dissociation inhibitor [Achlya hypogyna]